MALSASRVHTYGVEMAVSGEKVTLWRGNNRVLEDADLRVPEGQITAVIGPNGSGKSSLLHAVAGLLGISSGALKVLGAPPGAAHCRVAYVLQATAVSDRLPVTVREVVRMGRYAHSGILGRARANDRAVVTSALEQLDISDLAGRQFVELSGGQRQRVFVAQGLAQEADLLLLDEPVTGLDVVSRGRILDVMAMQRELGRSVLVTTHDLDEASLADHVLVLAHGDVVQGAPGEVLVPDVLKKAYGGHMLVVEPTKAVLVDDPHHHGSGGVSH